MHLHLDIFLKKIADYHIFYISFINNIFHNKYEAGSYWEYYFKLSIKLFRKPDNNVMPWLKLSCIQLIKAILFNVSLQSTWAVGKFLILIRWIQKKKVLIINKRSYCTYTINLPFLFLINHMTPGASDYTKKLHT